MHPKFGSIGIQTDDLEIIRVQIMSLRGCFPVMLSHSMWDLGYNIHVY